MPVGTLPKHGTSHRYRLLPKTRGHDFSLTLAPGVPSPSPFASGAVVGPSSLSRGYSCTSVWLHCRDVPHGFFCIDYHMASHLADVGTVCFPSYAESEWRLVCCRRVWSGLVDRVQGILAGLERTKRKRCVRAGDAYMPHRRTVRSVSRHCGPFELACFVGKVGVSSLKRCSHGSRGGTDPQSKRMRRRVLCWKELLLPYIWRYMISMGIALLLTW